MPFAFHEPMPPLRDAAGWLNGGPVEPSDLAGAPVLIHFWSQGCPTCKEQLPAVRRWVKEFAPRGLVVFGVHSRTHPEETDECAAQIAREQRLFHPIALDPPGAPVALRFGLRFVPGYFVYDRAGLLRHAQAGYHAELATERALRRVLEEGEAQHA